MIYLTIFIFFFVNFIFNSLRKIYIINQEIVIKQSGKWFPKYNYAYLAFIFFIGWIISFYILEFATSIKLEYSKIIDNILLILNSIYILLFLFIIIRYESKFVKKGLKIGPYSNFSIFLIIPFFHFFMMEALKIFILNEYLNNKITVLGLILICFVLILLGYFVLNGFPKWLINRIYFKQLNIFMNFIIQVCLCILILGIVLVSTKLILLII